MTSEEVADRIVKEALDRHRTKPLTVRLNYLTGYRDGVSQKRNEGEYPSDVQDVMTLVIKKVDEEIAVLQKKL